LSASLVTSGPIPSPGSTAINFDIRRNYSPTQQFHRDEQPVWAENQYVKKAVVLLAIVASCALSSASGTSLNVIPIADVLGAHLASRTYFVSGAGREFGQGSGALFGVGDRAELGFDADFGGGSSWNGKLDLVQTKNSAIAVGVADWADNSFTKFAVGRIDFGGLRLHAGFMNDGADRPIAGLDFTTGNLTWMVDHTGGPDAKTWFGTDVEFDNEVDLSFGASLPKGRKPTTGWYAMLSWTVGG
jgi:hypothetical protein